MDSRLWRLWWYGRKWIPKRGSWSNRITIYDRRGWWWIRRSSCRSTTRFRLSPLGGVLGTAILILRMSVSLEDMRFPPIVEKAVNICFLSRILNGLLVWRVSAAGVIFAIKKSFDRRYRILLRCLYHWFYLWALRIKNPKDIWLRST